MRILNYLTPLAFCIAASSSAPAVASSTTTWIQPASASLLDNTPWTEAADNHGIDPWMLYAISLEESGEIDRQAQVIKPWPYQLHRNGRTYRYDDEAEAAAQIDEWEQQGVRNYDIGALQINRRWHGHRVSNLSDLLDITTSLQVAAEILSGGLRSSKTDLELGVGRYR